MTAAAHAAEPADTAHTLREVVVTARRPADDIIPAQVLSGDELRRLNTPAWCTTAWSWATPRTAR